MRILTFICILFFALSVNAQTQYPRGLPSPSSNGYIKEGYTQIDSGIITNVRDTFLAKYPTLIKWSGNNKYYYTNGNGTAWYPLTTNATIFSVNAGWGLIKVNDSTLKADTSINGVATWALLKKKIDSVNANVNLRVKYSDTASMLSGYLPLFFRTNPTTLNINNKYFSMYGQNAIGDYTSGRLDIANNIGSIGYQKYGTFYGLQIDTLGVGTYNSHTLKPINYNSDYSANFTSNSLITKSYVDNKLALKVNISDTASMLTPYVRKSSTNSILYSGSVDVGNITTGGKNVTVTFPSALSTSSYFILGSIVSNGTAELDATSLWVITNRSTTSFTIHFREDAEVTQNIAFEYILFAK